MTQRTFMRGSGLLCAALFATPASALQFDLDFFGQELQGVLNTSMTLGAAMRMQDRSQDLLGKANINPLACGTQNGVNANSCQGINQNDLGPGMALVNQTGQFSTNFDNGNWNYDRYDLIQAPFKLTQDVNLEGDNWGIFGRWLYFYDFVNNDFDEFRPNYLDCSGPDRADCTPPSEADVLGTGLDAVGVLPGSYGSGLPTSVPRTNEEALRQAGTDLQILDLYFYTYFDLPGGRELSLKLGRQSVSWGESTLLVLGSLNSANPVNANNFFRIGFTPEEVFIPINTLYATTGLTDNLSIEAFYQLEWQPLEAPTPGTFFSFADLGTNDVVDHFNVSFGGAADDPYGIGTPLNNPLAALTDSTLTSYRRSRDLEASDSGQFGVSFKYYAEDLNNGTDIGFYFMNYHSRLPFFSTYATDLSCARTHPNAPAGQGANSGVDAFNLASLLLACPNLPLAEDLANLGGLGEALLDPLGGGIDEITGALGSIIPLPVISNGLQLIGTGEVTDAVPLDTLDFVLEYPEDIRMYGMSFNTAFGDLSLQGEFAYRPNQPVQVDPEDLVFSGFGPTLTSCHRSLQGGATQVDENAVPCGGLIPGTQDPLSQSGPNTFNLIPQVPVVLGPNGNGGDAPSVQRSFPSFITSYRGNTVGENVPNSYIRGFERIQTLQFTLGATYILGNTQNPIGADQVILLFEAGANRLLNAPANHVFQIEAPGTYRHASAGVVDPDSLAAGDTNASPEQIRQEAPGCYPGICVAGADGLRFNPQQETNQYTTQSAWGYRLIGIVRYESVLPGISVQPFFILGHDVNGISPGPGENFVEGRKSAYLNIETRYKSAWSFNAGYGWYTGGGAQNLLRDRDFAQLFLRYQF
nr:DUF1302 family protein [Oceanococcus sp. HetDA_MAG_MS8]